MPRYNSCPGGARGGEGDREFLVVRVNRDPYDTFAVELDDDRDPVAALEEAIDLASPDEGSIIEWTRVWATDYGAARVFTRDALWVQVEPQENPPRVFRPQKVVAQLQKETRPVFRRGALVASPDDVMFAISEYLGSRAHEVFLVLFVNIRNEIVGYTELTEGSSASVGVDVAGVMREALASNAAAIITIHNHPTGEPEPSEQDRALWNRLHDAGKLVGVPVLDNMVVGEAQYFSESSNGFARIPREAREGTE